MFSSTHLWLCAFTYVSNTVSIFQICTFKRSNMFFVLLPTKWPKKNKIIKAMQKMEFEEQNMKWDAHGTAYSCCSLFLGFCVCSSQPLNISEKDRVGLLNCTKYVNPTVYSKFNPKRANKNIYNIRIKRQNPSFPVLEANPLQFSRLSWRVELNLIKSWIKSWDYWPELSLECSQPT